MAGVDGEDVDAVADQLGGALEVVAGGADGGADAEAALLILGGVGVLQLLLDVLDGDEAFEDVVVVDDEELFDAMVVEDFFSLLEGGADGDGDEVFFGHHLADGDVGAGVEAEVAVGEDADELAVAGDGDAGDFVAAHDLEGVGDGLLGGHGDGVDDHAGLGALDLVDFAGLLLDGEVAMDDAESALLGHGDGHAGFGDGVHGGGEQRGAEGDALGEPGLGADLGGSDFTGGRGQKDIIEGQGFRQRVFNHDRQMRAGSERCGWNGAGGLWDIVEQRADARCSAGSRWPVAGSRERGAGALGAGKEKRPVPVVASALAKARSRTRRLRGKSVSRRRGRERLPSPRCAARCWEYLRGRAWRHGRSRRARCARRRRWLL